MERDVATLYVNEVAGSKVSIKTLRKAEIDFHFRVLVSNNLATLQVVKFFTENDEISRRFTRVQDTECVRCAECVLVVEFGGSAV